MCARTGWTWDYVWEEMSVDRIEAMERQWQDEPPVGLLVASFLGYKKKAPPATSETPQQAANKVDVLRGLFPTGNVA